MGPSVGKFLGGYGMRRRTITRANVASVFGLALSVLRAGIAAQYSTGPSAYVVKVRLISPLSLILLRPPDCD